MAYLETHAVNRTARTRPGTWELIKIPAKRRAHSRPKSRWLDFYASNDSIPFLQSNLCPAIANQPQYQPTALGIRHPFVGNILLSTGLLVKDGPPVRVHQSAVPRCRGRKRRLQFLGPHPARDLHSRLQTRQHFHLQVRLPLSRHLKRHVELTSLQRPIARECAAQEILLRRQHWRPDQVQRGDRPQISDRTCRDHPSCMPLTSPLHSHPLTPL